MQNRHIIFGPILAALAFLEGAQAVSPAPDGCYPNFTTAEGCNALKFLTSGVGNTGLGAFALYQGSDGGSNTGVGAAALALNTADSNTAVGATALLLNTTGIPIRPLEEMRSPTTLPPGITMHSVPSRSLTTTQVAVGLQTLTTPLAVTHS